jgi:hypothetical protein
MTATILAIDPGPEQSAYVDFRGRVVDHGILPNDELINMLIGETRVSQTLVIEQVAAMGMAVGAEVFETVFWSGRFVEAWGGEWDRVKRHEVKMFWCNSTRANDSNIRTAVIDRYGGKHKAIGNKRSPGPLYGISRDRWQALALAICYSETKLIKCRDAEVGASASLNKPKLKGA